MKMFLTRLGENSRMAVTGDLSQIDLPSGTRSGLHDAVETLQGVTGVDFVRFTDADVVRHPLVTRIVRAYDARDRREKAVPVAGQKADRSEEHTSELQSLMRISYAVFRLKKKNQIKKLLHARYNER